MRAARWQVALIVGLAFCRAPAEDAPPPVIFKSDAEAGSVEPLERQRRIRRPGEPQAMFVEATGEFNGCAAARLLQMELTLRQVEMFLGDGLGSKRAARERRTEQLLGALDAGVAEGRYRCAVADSVLAERIMDVRRQIVEHPELLGLALAEAPLATYTAARASRILNGLRDIPRNRKLNGVPDPCPAWDAACSEEVLRRDGVLAEVVRDLSQAAR
jgi:hypothetical protein